MHLSTRPTPPRTAEVPGVIRDRIRTVQMATILGGPNRVYASWEGYGEEEAPQPPWGRVIVMIGQPVWSTQEQGDRRRLLRILVRVECRPASGGYDPTIMLELAHREAFARLEGWRPPLQYAAVLYPLFRRSSPIPPEWDDERGLWLSAAEYRLVIGSIDE